MPPQPGEAAADPFDDKAIEKGRRSGFGIATDTDGDFFHQTQHLMVRVHLDNPRILRPVIQPVLR